MELKNTNPIIPVLGMDKDSHPVRLKDGSYTFASNINIQDTSGNTLAVIQSEASNILSYDFGSKTVIGIKYEPTLKSTFVMLVDESTKISEIGILSSDTVQEETLDVYQHNECYSTTDKGTKLEETTQLSKSSYKVLIRDCEDNLCLNFSKHHPIHSSNIVYKYEQCGQRLYWTDMFNEPRYLDIKEALAIPNGDWKENRYSHTGGISCGKEIELKQVCLDCEELKIFPNFDIPCIELGAIVDTGNLYDGLYEIFIAYSDIDGNEISNYYSNTKAVKIFSEQSNISESPKGRMSNSSISINLNFLDANYQFYKIAVRHVSATSSNISTVYNIGVYPISQHTVIISDTDSKEIMTLNNILTTNEPVQVVDKMSQANGYLFLGGLTYKRPINFQPIANLIGPFIKWQSNLSKEGFYKDPINASESVSFMRDEIYPLSISLAYKDGSYSNDFILPSRAPFDSTAYKKLGISRDSDLKIVAIKDSDGNFNSADLNVKSIIDSSQDCEETNRIYRWQYYNTAVNLGTAPRTTVDTNFDLNDAIALESLIKKSDTTQCSTIDLDGNNTIEGTFTLKVGEDYDFSGMTLIDYVNNNLSKYIVNGGEYFSPEISTIFNVDRYKNYSCLDSLKSNSKYCNNYKEISKTLSVYTLSENESKRVNHYRTISEYTILPVLYNETQFLDAERLIDYQFNSKYILEGFIGLQSRGIIYDKPSCSKPITPAILNKVTNQEELNGFSLPIYASRATDAKFKVVNGNFTSENKGWNTRSYPLPPQLSTSSKIDRIPNNKEGRALETWKYTRVHQSFSEYISSNALWFKMTDVSKYPFLQLNFISDQPLFKDIYQDSDINMDTSQVLHRKNDLALNRLGSVRLSIFKPSQESNESFCSTPQKALKTKFVEVGGIYKEIVNIQELSGVDSGELIVAIDSPIQQVKMYNVEFNRFYSENFRLGMGDNIVPNQYLTMQRFVDKRGDGTAYYKAFSVGDSGIPKAEGCWDERPGLAWTDAPRYGNLNFDQCKSSTDTSNHMQLVDDKTWTTTSTEFSIMVTQRGMESKSSTLEIQEFVVALNQSFSRDCYYNDISKSICNTTPYEHGIMGFHESLETYPDNHYLFDSSALNISENDIAESIIKTKGVTDFSFANSLTFKDNFRLNFGSSHNLIEKSKIDFRCKPMRFHKFPDNRISNFMTTDDRLMYDEAYISPIGLTLDTDVVKVFIELAYKKGLININEKNSIAGFRLKRGDRTLHKSVISKGFISDLIRYNDVDGQKYFPNFPYNSLGDKELISKNGVALRHQYNGKYNNRFSFISAETLTNQQLRPTEMVVDGYQFGNVVVSNAQMQGHPKMVILSSHAKSLASRYANIESTFEFAVNSAELLIQALQAGSGGDFLGIQGGVSKAAAITLATIALVTKGIAQATKTAEYRNKWIETFKNKGIGFNFGHYISGTSFFNNFRVTENTSPYYLRGIFNFKNLTGGNYKLLEPEHSNSTNINNIDREYSYYLYLGRNAQTRGITYPLGFLGLDTTNQENVGVLSNKETTQVAANLYVSLKRYNPSAYGRLENMTWITLPGCFLFENSYDTIFGGDTYISRITYKKKFSYFLTNALDQSSDTPFKYSDYFNIPNAKYFIDYETLSTNGTGTQLSFIDSDYLLQYQKESGQYVNDGKFYIQHYGITNHLVESEINGWARDSDSTLRNDFYPHIGDYMYWTQEKNLSIREPNVFLYNNVFSRQGIFNSGNFLPNNYNPEFFNCIQNSPSGLMYSNIDNSEKSLTDPWLLFKSNNYNNLPANYGKFISLESIESRQVLALFEHRAVIYNKIDEIKERITPSTVETGDGSLFYNRPSEFFTTSLGYGGTQHNSVVSSEFGRFWVDARRGLVFNLGSNGSDLAPIVSGMTNWFKEQLPFKILKGGIKNLTDLDLDKGIVGLGINLGWDSRFSRLFLTKLDYVVKTGFDLEYKNIGNSMDLIPTMAIVDTKTNKVVDFNDSNIFTPAHFTIAYSPLTKTWISYYDFHPNYYVAYDNYFRTGINGKSSSIWSHLLTNKSYGVYYGKHFKWGIEVSTKEMYLQTSLSNVSYWLESFRYQNGYDFVQDNKVGLESVILYNNISNSGKLNLKLKEVNNRFQLTQYPKINNDGSSDILVAYNEGEYTFNMFYDRVKKDDSNNLIWKYDVNMIHKDIVPSSINFNGRFLNRMRGDWFLMRFFGGQDSRYKQTFKWLLPKQNNVI